MISRFFDGRDRVDERKRRNEDHQRELDRISTAEESRRVTGRLDLLFELVEPLLEGLEELHRAADRLVLAAAPACRCGVYRWPGREAQPRLDAPSLIESERMYRGDEAARWLEEYLQTSTDYVSLEDRLVAGHGARKGRYAYSIPDPLPDDLNEVDRLMLQPWLGTSEYPTPGTDPESVSRWQQTLHGFDEKTRPLRTRCRVFGLDRLEKQVTRAVGSAHSVAMASHAATVIDRTDRAGGLALFDGYLLGSYADLVEASAGVTTEIRQLLGGVPASSVESVTTAE